MFLISKTYPGSDRIAWWDGLQWVANNHHAIEFARSKSALSYAVSKRIQGNYVIVKVSRKDPKPTPVPLAERNGESNRRTPEEKIDA